MRLRLPLIATLVSALLAAPASAQRVDDVRCLVLSNAFAQRGSTAAAKTAAGAAALFYLGKVDARAMGPSLRSAIERHQKTINVQTAGGEMQGCIRYLQVSAQKVQAATNMVVRR